MITQPVPPERRAILYLRFSPKPDAAECDTLETQRKQLLAYCQMHELVPVHTIEDPEVSGGDDLDQRPGGKELVRLLVSGAASHVVTQRVDRLSRNTRDGLIYVEDWAEEGIRLHFASQNGCSFDASTPEGHLMLTMLLEFATFERLLTRRRTCDKMQAKKANGERVSRLVGWGYRLSPDKKHLLRCHRQRQLRARVVQMLETGISKNQVARELNQDKDLLRRIQQRRPEFSIFCASTVNKILDSPE